MGKHSKKQTCSVCNGQKGQWVTDDGNGKRRWQTCIACNGTGEQ